jgi:tRNA (guanine37-N1)-methyltransferase
MSGHHAHIARWRREQSLSLTAQHRPELLEQARLLSKLSRHDETFLKQLAHGSSEASSPTAPKKL